MKLLRNKLNLITKCKHYFFARKQNYIYTYYGSFTTIILCGEKDVRFTKIIPILLYDQTWRQFNDTDKLKKFFPVRFATGYCESLKTFLNTAKIQRCLVCLLNEAGAYPSRQTVFVRLHVYGIFCL